MIGEATVPVPILKPPTPNYLLVAAASTSTTPFQSALDELLTLENVDGYTFQACLRARVHAELYLEAGTAIMGTDFPAPEFIPDGEGGIDIEWNRNQRTVTLSCRGNASQDDYIYWEENGEYEAKDATLTRLIHRLNWLNNA